MLDAQTTGIHQFSYTPMCVLVTWTIHGIVFPLVLEYWVEFGASRCRCDLRISQMLLQNYESSTVGTRSSILEPAADCIVALLLL